MSAEKDNDPPTPTSLSSATATATAAAAVTEGTTATKESIILFYKYHPLSNEFAVTERYRCALEALCEALQLKGRILVGCNKTEGLNGTLSGRHDHVKAFTLAMLKDTTAVRNITMDGPQQVQLQYSGVAMAITTFWKESEAFFQSIQEPELVFGSPEDFKWSVSSCGGSHHPETDLFPDLNIKLTKELIGSGGVMLDIGVEETCKGYLTPREWHQAIIIANASTNQKDSIIIDCRNTKEYEIGHFPGAIDPQTVTYSQFPNWVQKHASLLHEKKQILMYCTGGIRCEKASAFVRRYVPNGAEVKHLKGGIHKYLEEFGDAGLWQGKNFVFDARQAASAQETFRGKDGGASRVRSHDFSSSSSIVVVGKCLYCHSPHDTFQPHTVCTVCREPVLICTTCQAAGIEEFHCRQHYHLKTCYFANLDRFENVAALQDQRTQLQDELHRIAVGKKWKQKRKTLTRQIARVTSRIHELVMNPPGSCLAQQSHVIPHRKCRSCGDTDCPKGTCWGFFGLKRKQVLEHQKNKEVVDSQRDGSHSTNNTVAAIIIRDNVNQLFKKPRRGIGADEIKALQFHQPPSQFQHNILANGEELDNDNDSNNSIQIRCPPCATRVVQSFVKAKWCGMSVTNVLELEFFVGSNTRTSSSLLPCLEHGLVKVNNISVTVAEACNRKLKSGDVLSRVLHWHEPPVLTPPHIVVSEIKLPQAVIEDYGLSESQAFVLVCDKPSSVPVHPAGPYLANTLTVMVQAQEGLESNLLPIHRTDRATSGLTLLSTSSEVARIFHKCLSSTNKMVHKLYLAKVSGMFPSNSDDLHGINYGLWQESTHTVLVTASIDTPDPTTGIRIISEKGRLAQSVFKALHYDSKDDTSLVLCYPVTGRNHQLRVHLQALNCPILGDVQYGARKGGADGDMIPREAVLKILKSCSLSGDEKRLEGIQDHDVSAARKVCPNCSVESSDAAFTTAQLLQGGHSIHLHALCYRVQYPSSKKNKTQLGNQEFRVDLPCWAKDARIDETMLNSIWQQSCQ